MRSQMKGLAGVAAVLSMTTGVIAQSVWDVPGDGNWSVPSNWDPSGMPNSSSVHVIIDGKPSQDVTVTLDTSPAVGKLTIDAGDTLNIANGRVLYPHDTVQNDGLLLGSV